MQRNTLAAVLALVAAGAAFADDIGVDPAGFASSRTRAEVRSELQQYQRERVNPWSHNYDPLRAFRSDTTRAQARADFLAIREQVAAGNGEDGGAASVRPLAHRGTGVNAR
jgi:hypothetical protein